MPVPVKPPIKEIRIDLYWEDKIGRGTKSFRTVQQFAEFLREHPDLAFEVGYDVQGKRQGK